VTHQDKQLLSASAKKIIGLVKTKKNAETLIADILVNCVKQGVYTERQEWIEATKVLGPKNREKLLKEIRL
jgi:hypothetical protein